MWSHNPSSPPHTSFRGIFSVNVRSLLKNLDTNIYSRLWMSFKFVETFSKYSRLFISYVTKMFIGFKVCIVPIRNNFILGIDIKVNKG